MLLKMIPEDQVLDQRNLPKIKRPIGDHYGNPHNDKGIAPRLEGYAYYATRALAARQY